MSDLRDYVTSRKPGLENLKIKSDIRRSTFLSYAPIPGKGPDGQRGKALHKLEVKTEAHLLALVQALLHYTVATLGLSRR